MVSLVSAQLAGHGGPGLQGRPTCVVRVGEVLAGPAQVLWQPSQILGDTPGDHTEEPVTVKAVWVGLAAGMWLVTDAVKEPRAPQTTPHPREPFPRVLVARCTHRSRSPAGAFLRASFLPGQPDMFGTPGGWGGAVRGTVHSSPVTPDSRDVSQHRMLIICQVS